MLRKEEYTPVLSKVEIVAQNKEFGGLILLVEEL